MNSEHTDSTKRQSAGDQYKDAVDKISTYLSTL